jgi:hypothetical protein
MVRLSATAALAAAAALLCACDSRPDKDEPANAAGGSGGEADAGAEGKAEEGRISFKASGLDLAFDVPGGIAREARSDRDSKVLYPGASIGGIHVASAQAGKGGGESEVDFRYSTADPPEKVLAWYRDPARAEGFTLKSDKREGSEQVLTGVQARDKHSFKLRIAPKPGGGTQGRLTVHHHD